MKNITIPNGLFGFETHRNFTLRDSEYEPFMWLQSSDEPTLSFLVVDPFAFRPDYEMDIDDGSLSEIGITDPGDVMVMVIVTIPSEGPITANLQGPLVINKRDGRAKQVVLGDPKWSTKHDILEESRRAREKSC